MAASGLLDPNPETSSSASSLGASLPIANRRYVPPTEENGPSPVKAAEQPEQRAQLPIGKKKATLAVPQASYILDTITTPLRRGSASGDRRLPSLRTDASSCSMPKWAQSYSQNTEASPRPSPCASTTTSVNSSRGRVPTAASYASIRWGPEVFAQSWHRKLSDKYNIVNVIGEGASGAVMIVQHKITHNYFACKFLRKADQEPAALRREIQTLRRLDHPNIVRLYEVNEDSDAVFLLMELCQGGDLMDRICEERNDNGAIAESTAQRFAQQMLSALAHCHAHGIVHRDIKPENFLLDEEEDTLKLADFGIATSILKGNVLGTGDCDHEDKGIIGSLPYMAPEMLRERWGTLVKSAEGRPEVLSSSDLWSCGVSIYVMISGSYPFGQGNPDRICKGDPPDFSSGAWQSVSPEAIDLIKGLLNPIVEERLTAQQALAQGWLRGVSPGTTLLGSRHELAVAVLHALRRWMRIPKCRRIVITAIAKRLEEPHDANRVARAAYGMFGGASEALKCERLTEELDNLLLEVSLMPPEEVASWSREEPPLPFPSPASEPSRLQTLTGFHMRERVSRAVRRLGASPCSEATPRASPTPMYMRHNTPMSVHNDDLSTPGGDLSSSSMYGTSFCSIIGDQPITSELQLLVNALDGKKDGNVDYTLLVAALLPPEVYGDNGRISEVFEIFDLRRRGAIRAEDFQTAVGSKRRRELWQFKELVRQWDSNGDGVLDIEEFKNMVRGASPAQR